MNEQSLFLQNFHLLIVLILKAHFLSKLFYYKYVNSTKLVYTLITNHSYLLIIERLWRTLLGNALWICLRHLKINFMSKKLSLAQTLCYCYSLSFNSLVKYVLIKIFLCYGTEEKKGLETVGGWWKGIENLDKEEREDLIESILE